MYTLPLLKRRKEGRNEGVPHLLHVGRLGCIYHAAACLEARTSSSSLSLSLSSIEEAKNGRLFHLVGLACVCVPRARNAPRGKHESTSTCRLEWTMAAVTVKRTRGYRLTPLPRAYVTRHRSVHDHASIRWDCARSRSREPGTLHGGMDQVGWGFGDDSSRRRRRRWCSHLFDLFLFSRGNIEEYFSTSISRRGLQFANVEGTMEKLIWERMEYFVLIYWIFFLFGERRIFVYLRSK